jgi:probable selenium-dependent hydroxylase accessory protein YqeC
LLEFTPLQNGAGMTNLSTLWTDSDYSNYYAETNPDQRVIFFAMGKHTNENQGEEGSGLIDALGLGKREVISLTGAGGKTTLMYRLARELFLKGKRVVTTTTTKILEPVSGDTAFLFIHQDEEAIKQFVHRHLDNYKHVTLIRERLESGKLKGISSSLVDDLSSLNEIDYVIIEADGAAGRPVKAPRGGEPVIPSSTTLVVGILGVDGAEREVNEENVFRAERVSNLTGVPIGEKMTDEGMAILINHPEGIFKGAPPSSRRIAFINKVDIPNGVVRAKGIAQKIIERKHPQIERVVLGQLKSEMPVADVIFPSS